MMTELCENNGAHAAIKILYVHGYLGSGNGHSSRLLRQEFISRGIPCILDAPDFPVTRPMETRTMIEKLIEEKVYDCIVASSLGAFYSMQIPSIKKILVNIALPENLMEIKASDPDHNQGLSDDFFSEINREKDVFFSEIFDNDFRRQSYVVYGTRDSIAPNEGFLKKYYNDESRVFHIDMEHKLDEEGARKVFELIMTEKESA